MRETGSWKVRWTYPLTSHPWSVAFHPQRPVLAVGCIDKTVWLFDLAAGKPITSLKDGGALVKFSQDGNTLATVSGSWVTHWDAQDWHKVAAWPGRPSCE